MDSMKQLVLSLALLGLLLAGCGGGGPKLDARVLGLSVVYSANGPVSAEMTAGRGAATANADVECRLTTGDKPIIGTATANQFGAFTMPLDYTAFPQRVPTADEFRTFNDTVECRPQGGDWVTPLRPPQIRVG